LAEKRGKCLVTVYAEVPAEIEEEYNRWYDTHHIPARLQVPGFLSAARYVAYNGKPKYLTLYELESFGVFKHPQMVKLNNEPTEWDQRIMPQVQIVERAIYDRIFECGEAPERHASRATTVRFDPPAEVEAEFNDWYDKDHVPSLVAVPGMHCGRRYKKRWGEGAQYLALYEFDDESIPASDAWKKAADSEWTRQILPKLGPMKRARHRLIFEAQGQSSA
jgi:hypothetical protein